MLVFIHSGSNREEFIRGQNSFGTAYELNALDIT
jgi:hypothetical protein